MDEKINQTKPTGTTLHYYSYNYMEVWFLQHVNATSVLYVQGLWLTSVFIIRTNTIFYTKHNGI